MFQGFFLEYKKKPSNIILPNNKLNALLFYAGQKINKKNADMLTPSTTQKVTELKGVTTNSKTIS